ncbi:unnamed protein product [Lepidochelys kempii]
MLGSHKIPFTLQKIRKRNYTISRGYQKKKKKSNNETLNSSCDAMKQDIFVVSYPIILFIVSGREQHINTTSTVLLLKSLQSFSFKKWKTYREQRKQKHKKKGKSWPSESTNRLSPVNEILVNF